MQQTTQKSDNRNSFGGRGRRPQEPRVPSEYEERVLEVNRVTRVVKGGKRMRFRALVVIGNRNGKVAYGLGKATDVTTAVTKAVTMAKKDIHVIKLNEGSLPYEVLGKFKSAEVLIKPASHGTGLIAGGAVRVVLELAGVKDAVAKLISPSGNKVNNVLATLEGLRRLVPTAELNQERK